MMRLLTTILFSGALFAQSQLATVSGTIVDTSAAVIPGAHLKFANQETGEAWSATSNNEGHYTLPLIKPGKYFLDVEKAGFKNYRMTELILETGGQHRVDVKLDVGSQAERITVEASVPQLQTESSSVGAVVENRTIVDMPLINRRAAQLARLTGFVVQVGTGSNFAMGGGRGNNTNWRVDGSNVQNVLVGDQGLNFDPPIESLQEFSVSISNYSAELGRTGGGVVQMTTKSGTNQFHGSAYEYFRNDKLDARTFFAASKTPLHYNLFGASFSGPIRKDKTHFFFNYEGRRENRGSTFIYSVPTAAEKTGDFSANPIVVRDPEAAARAPFAGNRIPASRLDAIGAKLTSYFPDPNVAGQGSGNANFRANAASTDYPNNYVSRVDHAFNENDRLYGRFLSSHGRQIDNPTFATAAVDPFYRRRTNQFFNGGVTWFHNFKPSLINELRFNYDWREFINLNSGAYSDLNKQIGLKGVKQEFGPRVTITGFQTMGESSNMERIQSPIRGTHIADNMLWSKGKHNLKFGFERRTSVNDDLNRNTAGGLFGFTNTATGHGVAALLLGWVQSASVNEVFPIRSRIDAWGVFLQDDWKITNRLTLNLGLRWDMDVPRRELFDNRMNSFDLFAVNPVSGTPGVVTFAGRNGVSQYAHDFDRNNFAPRLGFAYRVTEKWVVRGGGAILYMGLYDQATVINSTSGFSYRGNFVSPDNGLTAALRLKDGLPPIPLPSDKDLNPGFGAVRVGQSPVESVEYFQPGPRDTSYMMSANVNVQRQLASRLLLEIGYLSTLGHKLASPVGLTLNQVRPELMGAGNAQIRRPFPQFTDVTQTAQPFGNSNYHAMNVKLEKRYGKGLQFQTNYTWGRGIDDMESRGELGGNPGSALANVYNRRADRGLSGNSIAHRLISSMVYELPFGKGRSFAMENRAARTVLGGWTIGYIGEFRTGPPLGVAEQTNNTNSFSPANRPNVVGSPSITGDRSRTDQLRQYFNTAAFAAPGQFVFGNAGRTTGFGPGAIAMDVSILKDLAISERVNLQFRTEMLNFINNPNFNLPNLQRGNATFGTITSLIDTNQARIIQFGLHLRF
ncbi:MAG: TonB-dependent receptor [Candidatus Solibacter usitatus]|nr:TonB-dependent receptor [Candidatus Solibacter usitatus]